MPIDGGSGGGGGVSSVTGTANQITVSPTTGATVVSLPTLVNLTALNAHITGSSSAIAGTFIVDSSVATQPALLAENATNFAQAGNILQVKMLNATDTGDVVSISNAGSGNYLTGDSAWNLTKQASLRLQRTISWYNAAWLYRRQITINNTQLEALTNFTVLISLNSTNFTFSEAQTAGQDIRITGSDGVTLLNFEIESWSTLAQTANIWVLVPSIDAASANDSLYIYYGNPAASDGQNVTSTWDSASQGVYHLPDGTTLTANDSTASPSNGTLVNTPTATTGVIDGGANFAQASSQYIDIGNPTKFQITGNLTISCWINLTDHTRDYMLVTKDKDTGGRAYTLDYQGNTAFRFYINGGSSLVSSTFAPTPGVWYYLVATYSTAGVLKIYINGQLNATVTGGGTSIPTATSDVQIGARAYSGAQSYLNGSMDEVRIDNVTRDAFWVAAQYLNQSNVFVTIGQEAGVVTANEVNTLNLIAGTASIATLDVTTGNFGNINLGGNLTLSGLLPAEIPYLNASKQLTGSPSITTDGTNLFAGMLLSGYTTNPGVVTGLDVAGTSRLGRQGQTDGSTTIAGILSVTFNSSGNSGFNFLAPNQNSGAIIDLNNNTAGEKNFQIGAGGHNISGGGGASSAEGTFSIANSTDGIFGFILEGYNSHNMHLGGNITSSAGAGSILDLVYSSSLAQFNGSVSLATVGSGISIKEGTNAKMGTGTLSGGTATISTTAVTTNSRIFLSDQGGTVTNLGSLYISARTVGTSFTVSSSNILDASNFAWIIFEPS